MDILLCSIVWWSETPSSRACSEFTAIRFLRSSSMAVIDWTSSWHGRRVSIMELSLSRPIQFGMLVYCCCSQLVLWRTRTLAPSPSNVPSSPPWKPTMILTMVIMSIISIISISLIITVVTLIHYMTIMTNICVIAFLLIIACSVLWAGWIQSALGWYTSLTTRNLSCTSFPFRVSSASFLWFPSVTPALSRTTCATHFLALPVTADRVLAMDARCGSSSRGLWDGRGTCNET